MMTGETHTYRDTSLHSVGPKPTVLPAERRFHVFQNQHQNRSVYFLRQIQKQKAEDENQRTVLFVLNNIYDQTCFLSSNLSSVS